MCDGKGKNSKPYLYSCFFFLLQAGMENTECWAWETVLTMSYHISYRKKGNDELTCDLPMNIYICNLDYMPSCKEYAVYLREN